MRHLFTATKIIVLVVLLAAGLSSCASTDGQKSAAEKEREEWYSNYVDNIQNGWSVHF